MQTEFQRKKCTLDTTIHAYLFFSSLIIAVLEFIFGSGRGQPGKDFMVGFQIFEAFTIDSNVLAGIASLLKLIYGLKSKKQGRDVTPRWVVTFQYIAAVCLFVTFVTVVLFLAPMDAVNGKRWYNMFVADMAFFHLINPLLAVYSFVFLQEKYTLHKKECLLGAAPLVIYVGIYFLMVVVFEKWVDFYGFTFDGHYGYSLLAAVAAFLLVFALSLLLIAANSRVRARQTPDSSSGKPGPSAPGPGRPNVHSSLKELEINVNSHTNKTVASYLVAEYLAIFVCNILCWIGLFDDEVIRQLTILMIILFPCAILAFLVRLGKMGSGHVLRTRNFLCILLILQTLATDFMVYSYVGVVVLIFPIVLTAFYPRTRIRKAMSLLMIFFSVAVPPLSLLGGGWDKEYCEFISQLAHGYGYENGFVIYETARLSAGMKVVNAIRFVSSQNLVITGAFAVVGKLIYRQTERTLSNQEEIFRLSEMDELTGLLNRNSFERRMESMAAFGSKSFSCFYFDANGLHELNNRYGHKAGDAMLQFVGQQIQKVFGEENAYRVGGDEYVAFAADLAAEKPAEIRASLEEVFASHGYHVAIGYTLCDTVAALSELVKEAEKDMYHEKRLYYSELECDRAPR